MVEPAFTDAASGVLLGTSAGQFTVTDACGVAPSAVSFPTTTVAVFRYVLQLAAVVGLVTCSVSVVPAGTVNALLLLGVAPHSSTCGVAVVTWQLIPAGIDVPVAASDQVTPLPLGSVSARVTPVASPAPALLSSFTTKPIVCPAFTVVASAVLLGTRAGQFTVTDACGAPFSPVSLPTTTVAVFGYVVQLAAVVGLVTCRVSVAPAGTVKALLLLGVAPHSSTCGEPVVTLQLIPAGIDVPVAASDQTTPLPDGSVSARVTPVASPRPALLSSFTTKPMGVPAFTDVASAVLLGTSAGQFTVTVACGAEPWPLSLPTPTVATLVYVPQLAAVVGLVTCSVSVACAGTVKVPVKLGVAPHSRSC